MNFIKSINRFDFNNHFVFNQNINPVTNIKFYFMIYQR